MRAMGANVEGRGHDNPAQANWRADRPAADPPHPEAPQAGTTETPPKKKKRHIATWIALASAGTAIASAIIASQQTNATNQQNTVAEQQQLVGLTTTIVQQLDQAQPSTSGDSDRLTLEGESAAVVISELHGDGVTDFEYDTVARALDSGAGDTTQAIAYYQDAVDALPHNVGTQASALRGEAVLFYELGQRDKGHEYFMQAVKVYSGHPEMLQYVKDNNIAQSYLADAEYQLNISGCRIASTDINEAEKFLSQAGGPPNATNAPLLTNDQAAYSKGCFLLGPPGTELLSQKNALALEN